FGITARRSLRGPVSWRAHPATASRPATIDSTQSRFMTPPKARASALVADEHLIEHDDHDDHEPDDEPIVECRARNLRQRIAKHPENERAEHGADDRSPAARQARAADDRRRDDVELVAGREIRF